MKQMNRNMFLTDCVRGSVLAGIVGLCTVLVSRENKFECSYQCGKCMKFNAGKCDLGIR